ncbi:MAG: c-type cytochrome biogenesis protein CcmI [Burkholderiales bacterium]
MIVFWTLAAIMTLVALALVVIPLYGRSGRTDMGRGRVNVLVHQDRLSELEAERAQGLLSEEQYRAARKDLEDSLVRDAGDLALDARGAAASSSRKGIVAAALVLPVAAWGLYLWLGQWDAIETTTLAQETPTAKHPEMASSAAPEMHQMEEMVARLEGRLKQAPGVAEDWVLLARSYGFLKRHGEAAQAFARAHKLKGDDPKLLADYAEALALANGNRMEGEPARLVKQALKRDPQNNKALWLAGVEGMQRGDKAGALAHWGRLKRQLPGGSSEAESLNAYIAQVEGVASPDALGPAAVGVRIRVSLDPALKPRAAPGDAVFVFARAVQGPRMPLAIVRKQVKDLPLEMTLDDSHAMSPQMSLSGHDEVIVGARISKTGDAMARAGDSEGFSAPVKVGADKLAQVRIDRVIP